MFESMMNKFGFGVHLPEGIPVKSPGPARPSPGANDPRPALAGLPERPPGLHDPTSGPNLPTPFSIVSAFEFITAQQERTLRFPSIEELITENSPYARNKNKHVKNALSALRSKREVITKIHEKHTQLKKKIPSDASKRIESFQSRFRTWDGMRSNTLRELNKLVRTLNNNQEETNKTVVTGGTVGAVGAGAAIAGLLLSPFTGGASALLTLGGVAAAAGTEFYL